MGDGSRLYVCGTNAHNPKDLVINVSVLTFLIEIIGKYIPADHFEHKLNCSHNFKFAVELDSIAKTDSCTWDWRRCC